MNNLSNNNKDIRYAIVIEEVLLLETSNSIELLISIIDKDRIILDLD